MMMRARDAMFSVLLLHTRAMRALRRVHSATMARHVAARRAAARASLPRHAVLR